MEKTIHNSSKIRFSGLELFKIIAIFLICISHANQTAGYMLSLPLSFGSVSMDVISYFGQIGNNIFVICSAWFLLDSKRTKAEKIFNLAFDSMLISIIILSGFLFAGFSFSSSEIIKQVFPDIFKNVWFVPTYLIFYAVHPILNFIIKKINQKFHLIICIAILALTIAQAIFSFGILSIICFVLIYFVVAYFKKYCQNFTKSTKKNVIWFVALFLVYIGCAITKSVLSYSVDYFANSFYINHISSPILMPMVLCLFNIFNNMKFENKYINYFASCSLFVYCIHENILLRSITRPQFYDLVFAKFGNLYFLWIILCGIGMFVGAYILAIIYKETLHKFTAFLSKKLSKLLDIIIAFFVKIFKKKKVVESQNAVQTTEKIENTKQEVQQTNKENSLDSAKTSTDFWEKENVTNN